MRRSLAAARRTHKMAEAEQIANETDEITKSRAELRSDIEKQIAEQRGFNVRAQELARKQAEERKPYYQDVAKAEAELAQTAATKRPTMEKLPQPPDVEGMVQPTNLQRMFGTAAIFSLLAVGLTKGDGIEGLRALGGFMQGAREGNMERAEAAIKTYNLSMDRAVKGNELALKEYNSILADKKISLDAKERLLKLKMYEHEDQTGLMELEQKGMKGIFDLMHQRATLDHQMMIEQLRTRQVEAQIKKLQASTTTGAESVLGIPIESIPAPTPGQKNEAFLNMLPPAKQELVRRMASGDLPVSGFGGLSVKDRNELLKAATLYDPAFTGRQYLVLNKVATEFTPGGPVGTNILAIKTVSHHIDDFAKAFEQLNNSQIQRWNSTANKLATEFGDPALQRLQVSALSASGELAKVVKGGRAAPTEQEMQHWEGVFNTSMSKAQMKAVVWQALQTVGGRLSAIEDYHKQITGKEFGVLDPNTKQLIAEHKPKNVPAPSWLRGGGGPTSTTDLSDLEKQAELNPQRKVEITNQARTRAGLAPYPTAKNPTTGEIMIFKDGQWQKVP